MLQGIQHNSNVATALAGLAALIMGVVVIVAFLAARRYRRRTQVQSGDKVLTKIEN